LKKELNPAVVGVFLVIAIAAIAIFLWRGTGGPGSKKTGEVGNPSPFSPGGYAAGKGVGGKPELPGGRPPGIGAPGNTPSGNPGGR